MIPLRTYEYLEQARERVLDAAAQLDTEQYRQVFDIGPGSLAVAFTHLLISEWYYIERLHGREVPPYEQWEIKDEHPLPFGELRARWGEQAQASRRFIEGETDWGRSITYRVTDDEGRLVSATCTAGGLLTQLFFHEIHHRAQILNMLRRHGVTLEDIDFNAVMFEREFINA